jgi:hypothetical protein
VTSKARTLLGKGRRRISRTFSTDEERGVTAEHWGEDAREKAEGEEWQGLYWQSYVLTAQHINEAISGDPAVGWLPFTKQRFFPRPAELALSLGCGYGIVERVGIEHEIADRFEGYDIAPEAVEVARSEAEKAGIGDRIDYAAADVRYLVELSQILERGLESAGRLSWAQAEFASLEQRVWPEREFDEQGYTVARGCFSAGEMKALLEAIHLAQPLEKVPSELDKGGLIRHRRSRRCRRWFRHLRRSLVQSVPARPSHPGSPAQARASSRAQRMGSIAASLCYVVTAQTVAASLKGMTFSSHCWSWSPSP